MKCLLIAAFCPLLCGGNAWGASYYVAPWGDDGNPGRLETPLATVSKAVAIARAGDVIILRDGVYGPEGRTSGFPVWISRPGTPTAWITLKAENKGRAILDCQNSSGDERSGCDGYIYLHTGAAYWVLQDLVFRNGFNFGASSNSVPAAHDILVRGCRFESIGRHRSESQYGEAGFYAGPGAFNLTFDANSFHDIGRTGGLHLWNDHALYLHSNATTVVNNIFYAPISGWGIQTASGFSGLIANNTFAFPLSNPHGHVMLWETNSSVTVQNNIFYYPGGGVAINTSAFNVTGGCSITNNLVVGGVIGNVRGCAISNNLSGDPGFLDVSLAPFDFHLRPGSSAIGAGTAIPAVTTDFDGNPRPQGGSYDLGAFQFVLPANPPGGAAPSGERNIALPKPSRTKRPRQLD